MKGYWTDTRPNGKPVESGTVCWVTDLEDGSHPIYTYGENKDEVLSKLSQQNAHAQIAMARRAAPAKPVAILATQQPAARRITAEQVMQATADLENPGKAGHAIATLVESATGLNLEQVVLQNFARIAMEWEAATPEFFSHPGNQRMLTQEATGLAGGKLGNVTREHLQQAFLNLQGRGELFEGSPSLPNPNPSNPSPFPDESQVQRSERPRGTRFATGSRSTSFRTQAPTRTLKYTEEEILRMPASQSRRLIESNDRDYADACDAYFGKQAQASA